eukprot:1161848-Pelagomonas_calceolata.AAC.3
MPTLRCLTPSTHIRHVQFAELKRRGITCTSVKGGQRMFSMAGQPAELSATEIASLLRLRAR